MDKLSHYDDLLDNNKPAEVLASLGKYKGNDGKIYFIIAEARRMLGHFEEAIVLYNKALKLYKPIKLKKGVLENTQEELDLNYVTSRADMQIALAKCYRTLGNAKKAYDIAEIAYKAAQNPPCGLKAGDFIDFEMLALQEMAMALRAYGKLDESLVMLNEVMEYYKNQKDFSGQGFIHWAIGGICRLKGQFKEGILNFKEAIKLAKKGHDAISEAYGYCGLAGISRIAGDVKGCVDNYLKAEKIFKNTDDVFGKAYTNCGMANGLRQLGEYDAAFKRYIKADALYSSINDTVDLGFVKWGKADVLKRRDKLEEALAELKAAKKLFASSDEIRGQILTEIALAQVIYAMGDKKQADIIYDKAVIRAKEEGLHTYLESFT